MKALSRIYDFFPSVNITRKIEKDAFLARNARERGLIEEADKIEARMKRRIRSYADQADQRTEYRLLGYACLVSLVFLFLLLSVLLYPIVFIFLLILLIIAIPLSLSQRKKMNSEKRRYFSDSALYEEEKKKKEQSEKNMKQGFEKGLFTWNPVPPAHNESSHTVEQNKEEKKAHIILRFAEESDRTYIARLNFLTDVFGDEKADLSSHFLEDARYYVDEWSPSDGGFIAFDDQGIPAGGVWLRWGKEGWGTDNRHGYGHYRDGYPELAIAVENRYQGSGVGTRLLTAAIEFAKEAEAPGISLCVDKKNPKAHRLYKKLGFQEYTFLEEHDLYVLFMTFPEKEE